MLHVACVLHLCCMYSVCLLDFCVMYDVVHVRWMCCVHAACAVHVWWGRHEMLCSNGVAAHNTMTSWRCLPAAWCMLHG